MLVYIGGFHPRGFVLHYFRGRGLCPRFSKFHHSNTWRVNEKFFQSVCCWAHGRIQARLGSVRKMWGPSRKFSDINVHKTYTTLALQPYAVLLLVPHSWCGVLNAEVIIGQRMSCCIEWTFKCRNTPERGPHRPGNVALLFDILWPVGAPFCGDPVRSNILNMLKSASDWAVNTVLKI